MKHPEKVIGILGGMGPEATLELFRRIMKKTPARCDQEHIRVIIDSNPKIPDRTEAMLNSGPDPLPLLQETARNLERAGADFIVMPCNTAHYYLSGIRAAVRIPVIDMIRETAYRVREHKVGILATDGTLSTRLYHDACAECGIEIIEPQEEDQQAIMQAIYNIKAGRSGAQLKARVLKATEALEARGAQAIIVGCTEISLILTQKEVHVPLYDAMESLAETAVAMAKKFTEFTQRGSPGALASPQP